MKRLLCNAVLFFVLCSAASASPAGMPHQPLVFITKGDAMLINRQRTTLPLLQQSFNEARRNANEAMAQTIDVPVPKDPAGGYTHDRHKGNYAAMYNAGLVYAITGQQQYADFVISMLMKYADLVPGLPKHPESRGSSPGRLFHQALNDANWLVYSAIAYDCVKAHATKQQREKIETGAFKPMCSFITVGLKDWFNLIHNHGVWAAAGVGITGIAIGDDSLVQQSLYGTGLDGKSGFIAQLDNLFSPDGYYTEGPYYARYALLPFYLFAEALNNKKPELKIFEHRKQVLKKALYAALQQTNTNGAFFPVNDAIKDKTFISSEIVTAVNIAYAVYNKPAELLSIAAKQQKVLLNGKGLQVARALQNYKGAVPPFPYASVEYTDGANGKEGGLTILRNGQGNSLTTVVVKHAAHGLSHGHYDALNLLVFDKGNEILQDYGAARFLNVEQKDGGRYLPENKKYAMQTIAHNTLVVDEKSHFDGKEAEAEKHHSEKLFSDFSKRHVKVVAAQENNAYANVSMQRSVYLLQLPGNKKLVIDLFRVAAPAMHQYDLPFQYQGQFIHTTAQLAGNTSVQKPLGKKNGYEFLWNEAEACVSDTMVQFTFLNQQSYYSLSGLVQDSATVYFTRTGANDPNFNLRREPAMVIRKKGSNQAFMTVLETHGNFDPVNELSFASRPAVKQMALLRNDEQYSVMEISLGNNKLLIAQSNHTANSTVAHSLNINNTFFNWVGPYQVLLNGKPMQ